jgi:hypothetical protein
VKTLGLPQRRAALLQAVQNYGFPKTIAHLVLIANYTRRSDPSAYIIFKTDQEFLSKMYNKQKVQFPMLRKKSARRKRRHM